MNLVITATGISTEESALVPEFVARVLE